MADAKQIVRRLIEEPWTGNMDVIDELIGSGYIGYDPSAPEPISGPDGARTQIQQYIDGFPNGRITVDDQIAEGDKVASRWTARGTQTGEVAGIAPTGKEVSRSRDSRSRGSRTARWSRSGRPGTPSACSCNSARSPRRLRPEQKNKRSRRAAPSGPSTLQG